ncbi:MAG: hypothetical protein A2018_00260 [Alphaproteobacteria bacterium GWF2_58_20]|nr:MAG: hypothetical protein A2018_00260 [Alphaproteobacteria bacterium GWF2_58_20]
MRVVAVTGAMGAGKSTLMAAARELRLPVFCSDKTIRRIRALPALQAKILARTGGISRADIWRVLDEDATFLDLLERWTYPFFLRALFRFVARHERLGTPLVVLEIPLLFELGLDGMADVVVSPRVAEETRRARVLSRPGMTEARMALLEAHQWPAEKKAVAADVQVPTDCSPQESLHIMKNILVRELQDA